MDAQHDDRLIAEMLGGAVQPRPDEPVLLGEYSQEGAEACGAFHDPGAGSACPTGRRGAGPEGPT